MHRREVGCMHRFGLCLLIVLFSFPVSVSAEFYKFYDENGNVHFTDDYNKVPVDQRPNVEGYVESTSPEEATGDSGQPAADKSAGNTSPEKKNTDLSGQLQGLEQRKEALDKEYQSLIEENDKLEKMRKTVKTADDVKKYNQNVSELNQKLQAHDKKRQAYASDIEAYNARIIKANESKFEKKPQKSEEPQGTE